MSTGKQTKQSMGCQSVKYTDILTHHEQTEHKYVFQNAYKIETVHNAKNMNWQSVHNSVTTDKTGICLTETL